MSSQLKPPEANEEQIGNAIENAINRFPEWVKNNKKFLMVLSICILLLAFISIMQWFL
jgi:hypothetical protein